MYSYITRFRCTTSDLAMLGGEGLAHGYIRPLESFDVALPGQAQAGLEIH